MKKVDIYYCIAISPFGVQSKWISTDKEKLEAVMRAWKDDSIERWPMHADKVSVSEIFYEGRYTMDKEDIGEVICWDVW